MPVSRILVGLCDSFFAQTYSYQLNGISKPMNTTEYLMRKTPPIMSSEAAHNHIRSSLSRGYIFAMRSMASGGAFHVAYYHATQQAFLEAHELAFNYFGGVFRRLRYDNLKSAVKKILRGHQREETERLIAFPLALGVSDGVLQSGAREREGRRGRRGRLLPPESSGAGSAGAEPGRVERTVTA